MACPQARHVGLSPGPRVHAPVVALGDRPRRLGTRFANGVADRARALFRVPRGATASLMRGRNAVGALLLSGLFACIAAHAAPGADWSSYGGDAAASHYSPLTSIAPTNVSRLKLAWSYK